MAAGGRQKLGSKKLRSVIASIVKATRKQIKKSPFRKRKRKRGAGLRVRPNQGAGCGGAAGKGVSVLFPSSGSGIHGGRKRKRGGALTPAGGALRRAGEGLSSKQKKILSVLL